MPAGRPSKYTDELLELAAHYADNYTEYGDVMPSVIGLSLVLNIRRETLHVWANEEGKEEISNILSKINAKQHQELLNKGLTGDFNPAITKLALGKHGYHDKQDSTLSGPDGKPLETDSKITIEFVTGGMKDESSTE